VAYGIILPVLWGELNTDGRQRRMHMLLILSGTAVVTLLWFGINAKLFADNMSPFQILYFSWILPLLLCTLQLSNLERPWEIESIGIIAWVTLCLLLPSILPAYLTRTVSESSFRIVFAKTVCLVKSPAFKCIVLFLFTISFSAYIYSEFVTNPVGIPLVSALTGNMSLGGTSHRWGKETKWSLITPLLFILTPLLYLIAKSTEGKTKRSVYFCLAFSFPFMGILKLSRSDILIGVLNVAFIEYHWRKTLLVGGEKRQILNYKSILLGAIGILIAYGTLYIRTGMDKLGNFYARMIGFKLEGTGIFVETFAQIYGYLALPFENFHNFFETYTGGYSPGISVLRPLLSMLGKGSLADEMLAQINYEPLGGAAGSATFLTFMYAELGIWGLLFVPLIYSIFVNTLYVRFRANPSFINLFLYLNFVYPWFWLFFNNAFSVLTFYINMSFIIIIFLSYCILIKSISKLDKKCAGI